MNLSKTELLRYSRQLSLKEIGVNGQQKIKSASVLVTGAGGLGSSALLYLSAAGIGKIGVMDFDKVALHNLQRQVIYDEDDIGKQKAEAATEHLRKKNSGILISAYNMMLTADVALNILPEYDIILDCTDNLEARYVINDACVRLGKPFVYGSVFRFEGQLSLFNAMNPHGVLGPTYRCLYPEVPEAAAIPSCEEAGVAGFLPGLIGTLQAAEVIKYLIGSDESLSGKLLTVNALTMHFDVFEVSRNESLWNEKKVLQKSTQ